MTMLRSCTLAVLIAAASSAAAQSPPEPTASSAGAPAAQPTPPPPGTPSPHEGKLFTWGSAGAAYAYGEWTFGTNLGVGYRLKGGVVPNIEWFINWFTPTYLSVLRPGVIWQMGGGHLAPFAGVHFATWYANDGRNAVREYGLGGRVGFFLWKGTRRDGSEPLALSTYVTYDRAVDCSRNCDIWSPQLSLTWTP